MKLKNKKVIQAITIGLAAMMSATSSPVMVLANEGEENQTINNNNESSQSTNTVSETAGSCADIINENNNQITEATEAITEASNAVENIVTAGQEQNIEVPTDVLTTIQGELQEGANDISAAGSDLEIAVEAFNEALTADLKVDNALDENNQNSLVTETKKVAKNVQDFDGLNTSTTQDANDAINQADIANNSKIEKEAYDAKDLAEKELANAETGLKAAQTAYDLADDAVKEADKKYQEALNDQKEAKEKLQKAKDKLNDANTNATAANEMLKAAQAKLDKLDSEVAKLAQSKDDLEALKNQYYKLMVHYYRDKNINSAVYDENGELLVEESALKAKENGKTNNPSVTENTLKIGRELMKDLVMYKLKENGAEDIQFAVQEKGLTKKESADGELTTDDKGNDKVIITDTQDQYWNYPSGDDGRHHRVKVTYTITLEDGTKQNITEYYNYIYKANKYNDDGDVVNGPIYLAQIDNETGEVIRDTDKNNMDDFVKLSDELNKAIEASKIIDEYNAAKDAVDKAQDLVDTLNETIKTLSEKELKIDETRVAELKEKLDDAKEILKQATEDKATLEGKVEEARKAVASIDLSRFNKKPTEDPSEDEPEDTSPSEPTIIIPTDITPIVDDIPVVLPILPSTSGSGSTSVAENAGVAGVRVEPSEEIINKLPEIIDKDGEKLVKIEDNEIPLSDIPNLVESEHSIWWWIFIGWLLLLIAYIIYRLTKKKKEEENKEVKE